MSAGMNRTDVKLSAGELSFKVLDIGSGEPALLFLHYWGGSARTWHAVTQQLLTDFRCVAYDQRGWGGSDAPAQGYSIRDLAFDAREIVRALGLKRFALVGHSMGGKVAQLLASQRPTGVEKLILVAPAAPTPQNIPDFAKEAQASVLRSHLQDDREPAFAKPTARQALALQSSYRPAPFHCLPTNSCLTSPLVKN
jgi:3-oxoadipate enol-lactonase